MLNTKRQAFGCPNRTGVATALVEPISVDNPDAGSPKEIFGPVLAVTPCRTEEELIGPANDRRLVSLLAFRLPICGVAAHHVMHTVGSRLLGFTQELFDDSRSVDPEVQAVAMREMARTYPHVVEIAMAASHEGMSVVGQGCDDQFEFEFALDLLLNGFELLRLQQ